MFWNGDIDEFWGFYGVVKTPKGVLIGLLLRY